jgi:hypothetical protein
MPGQNQSGCSGSQTISEDKCTIDTNGSCPLSSDGMNYTLKVVGATTQENADASLLEGIATVTLLASNGDTECTGTYRLKYTRQQ